MLGVPCSCTCLLFVVVNGRWSIKVANSSLNYFSKINTVQEEASWIGTSGLGSNQLFPFLFSFLSWLFVSQSVSVFLSASYKFFPKNGPLVSSDFCMNNSIIWVINDQVRYLWENYFVLDVFFKNHFFLLEINQRENSYDILIFCPKPISLRANISQPIKSQNCVMNNICRTNPTIFLIFCI